MPITRRRLAPLAALLALALTACQTLNPVPPDPLIAELARSINTRASAFFSALAATQAPDCDFEHNAPAYADLAGLAGRLQVHLASGAAEQPMRRAADALARAIADARLIHEKASAVATDPSGPCLAREAITLNAGAIGRASQAIVMTQTAGEDR